MQKNPIIHLRPPGELTVLVVDDEEAFHDIVEGAILAGMDYQTLHAYSGEQCIEVLTRHRVDVVLLDLNLPDGDGFRVLEDIRESGDEVIVIVVSAYADPRSIRRARTAGAWMVLDKRFEDYRRLPHYIAQGVDERKRNPRLASSGAATRWDPWLLSDTLHAIDPDAFRRLERSASLSMQRILRLARAAAALSTPVLIESEPGSDRELIARYLHAYSDSSHAPFAATEVLPGRGSAPGDRKANPDWKRLLVSLTADGTLFIDQVHRLDGEGQRTLLRVITETVGDRDQAAAGALRTGPRIVASTSIRLAEVMRRGEFDADLCELLCATHMVIPPLRERPADVASDLAHLIEHTAAVLGVKAPRYDPELATVLSRYPFPGNEQELRAMVALGCVRKAGAQLELSDLLPPDTLSRDDG